MAVSHELDVEGDEDAVPDLVDAICPCPLRDAIAEHRGWLARRLGSVPCDLAQRFVEDDTLRAYGEPKDAWAAYRDLLRQPDADPDLVRRAEADWREARGRVWHIWAVDAGLEEP